LFLSESDDFFGASQFRMPSNKDGLTLFEAIPNPAMALYFNTLRFQMVDGKPVQGILI